MPDGKAFGVIGHSWTDWAFIMEYNHTEVTIRDEAGQKQSKRGLR